MSRAILTLLVVSAISTSLIDRVYAQSQAAQSPAPAAAAATPANLAQLMRGTLYPESNVVFAAQDVNPADVPHAKDPSMATDPLESSYGKRKAVEKNPWALAKVGA